ncbi:MAG: acyl-CoA dehydrogenase [Gammaproteobacteria bacterium]|nr:acyl-CoA dehydrogenase [Gammaproteobacteria bacterium]
MYTAPTKDLFFAATELADLKGVAALPGHEEVSDELLSAILEEAGKFASEVLAPINHKGDIQGARFSDGKVTTPDGWKEAYRQFIDGGWNGLSFDTERGGQGLPWLVSAAVQEIWYAANMAFGLCPLLTQGAIEAVESHASEEQKATYLNNMVSGEWTGTMNLTEPQAGSDLAAVKTKAVKTNDHYRISGQKIFITYGDHDMTENIIHLVLARTPDAPEGVKGISLFIVPKFLQDDNGNWTIRNDVETLSIEHKLGIHGSPTAVLGYGNNGGAIGYLVGEENRGLMYMFTMMNAARHTVGVQGNAVAERAYQQAIRFAAERVQGKAIEDPMGDRVAIIEHPDVKRLLLVQKCRIEPLRALCLLTASAMDKADRHLDDEERKQAQGFIEVMIPIVKGYTTEMGLENVSLALQIHGGMGFIEETGAAQHYRDQRITPIYEGTTGIQAMDIVGRKLLRDGGVMAATVIEMIAEDLKSFSSDERIARMVNALNEATDDLQLSIAHILNLSKENPQLPAAISEPYLRLWGVLVCGWLSAKAASVAVSKMEDGDDDMFYQNKIHTAKFYFSTEMPKIKYYAGMIRTSGELIVEMNSDRFSVG